MSLNTTINRFSKGYYNLLSVNVVNLIMRATSQVKICMLRWVESCFSAPVKQDDFPGHWKVLFAILSNK